MDQEVKQLSQGIKHDDGKLRFDLLPVYPLMRLVEVYTIGAKKYTDRNWEKGLKFGRTFAALLRHAFKWWAGETFDPVDGQHHLASVVWNAMALMEFEKTHPELDDRPKGAATHNDLQKDLPPSALIPCNDPRNVTLNEIEAVREQVRAMQNIYPNIYSDSAKADFLR